MKKFIITLLISITSLLHANTEIQPIDRIVAIVDDDIITQSELNQQIHIISRELDQTPDPAALNEQVLNSLISRKLQLQLAERTGIRVDDHLLNTTIENIAENQGMNLPEFRAYIVEETGLSYAQYRQTIRDDLIINQLQRREVANRIILTDEEINKLLAEWQSQTDNAEEYYIKVIFVAIPDTPTSDEIAATEQRIQQIVKQLQSDEDFEQLMLTASDNRLLANQGDLGWRKNLAIPTAYVDTVSELSVGDISDPIQTGNGFHIIKLVDKRNAAGGQIVTQYQVRHILLTTNNRTSAEDVQQQLTDIRDQIIAGESFAALAKKYSQDPISATRGGELGWETTDAYVPAFADVVESLSVNDISEPFETQFGWHIVQVTGQRDYDNTFDLQRNQAQQILFQRKLEEQLPVWLQRLYDQAFVENLIENE